MIGNEVYEFLMPQDNSLQLSFLSAISMLTIITILLVTFFARAKMWEKKWVGEKFDDGLDVDHGSVSDISSAVMTWAEKIAEIMPGILLVIGLLGTFINLGIALDYASKILASPHGMGSVSSAHTMNDIMGLLNGLGAKFKTSTWGIIGFLVLRFYSSLNRYDERRLQWSIKKMKSELLNRRKETQEFYVKTVDRLSSNVDSFKDLFNKYSIDANRRSSMQQKVFLDSLTEVLDNAFGKSNELLIKSTNATIKTSDGMNSFVKGTRELIKDVASSAKLMASNAEHVGFAAHELVGAIDSFKSQFADVLDNVRIDLGSAISNMSEQASSTLEKGAETLSYATNNISNALDSLSTDLRDTMGSVEKSIMQSLDIQKNVHSMFVESSDTLNSNVNMMTNLVDKLTVDIKSSLKSVTEVGRKMESIGNKLNGISGLPDIQASLIEEIKDIKIYHELATGYLKQMATVTPPNGLSNSAILTRIDK
jgi:methyl-accepting chemotaxis protein/uncharacterized membrane protein YphA (DoxX/SURF4 family)